jgi:hypothetical protein
MGPAYDPELHTWAEDVRFLRNTFYIPNIAPRLDPRAGGEIYFSGVTVLKDNQYLTDQSTASSSQRLRVSYDQSSRPIRVINDIFPADGGIYPVAYPSNIPYPLNSSSALNLP